MTRVFDEDQGPTPDPPQPPGPKLGLTTPRLVVVAALAGAVVGWFVVETMQSLGRVVPVTPWSMSLLLVVAAGVAWFAASAITKRAGTPGALESQSAVTALVLGKTMVLTGALLGGGHVTYVLTQVGQWEAALPRQRVIWGLVAVVASAVFAYAGWRLEKACWVDDDTDDDPSPA